MQYNYYNDREAWVARVRELMQPKQWIMDGNYNRAIAMRCEAADVIILFNLPRWLCLYRVLKRSITLRNKQRADMPSEWSEKINLEFLKYVWTFDKRQTPLIKEQLAKSPVKHIHIFKTTAAADKYLATL